MIRPSLLITLLAGLLLGLCCLPAPAAGEPVREASVALGTPVYTLQLATFADKSRAEHLAERLPEAWIQQIRKQGRTLYRVNYKRFSARTEAIQAQWALEDRGYRSLVLQLFDEEGSPKTSS